MSDKEEVFKKLAEELINLHGDSAIEYILNGEHVVISIKRKQFTSDEN